MPITRDVVTDLWPVYASGEASADTRALVEEFLAKDAQFGRLIREPSANLRVAPELAPDQEMRALARTKQLLRRRSAALNVAILLTLLPFSFVIGRDGVHWMWSNDTRVAALCGGLAVIAWTLFVAASKRTRATGL